METLLKRAVSKIVNEHFEVNAFVLYKVEKLPLKLEEVSEIDLLSK